MSAVCWYFPPERVLNPPRSPPSIAVVWPLTRYPVLGSASSPVVQQAGRDHDYARKQWSGLIDGVFVPRVALYRDQALRDAGAGRAFNDSAATASYARMACVKQPASRAVCMYT